MPFGGGAAPSIERTRLLALMTDDATRGADVLAICAPAGSGKTTVLGQWAGQRRASGDLVVAALAGRVPASKAGAPPHWLVIDDVHDLIADKAGRSAVRDVVSAAGSGMRVVAAARSSLRELVPHLFLHGAAREYRLADLAFDRDETLALAASHGVVLSSGEAETLLTRTEGWVVSLELAAMAMSRVEDRAGFLASFSGDDHAVAGYLATEVIDVLPPDVVDLLLAVAVADEVDARLAEHLSGRPDAGRVLHQLDASNAFVRRRPGRRGWYDLHPLLRGYLLAESDRRDAGRRTLGRMRASAWFDHLGDPVAAIRYAVEATDWPRVDALLADHGPGLLVVDGPEALEATFAAVPASARWGGGLAAAAAIAATADGNIPAARVHLATLKSARRVPEGLLDVVATAVILGASAETSEPAGPGDARDALATASVVLDTAPARWRDVVLFCRALRASTWMVAGQFDEAEAELVAVARIARREGLHYLLMRCLVALSGLASVRGDAAGAHAVATEAVGLAQAHGWEDSPLLARPLTELALVAWLRGDDDEAVAHASRAEAVADLDVDPLVATVARSVSDMVVLPAGAPITGAMLATQRQIMSYWRRLPAAAVALVAGLQMQFAIRAGDLRYAHEVVDRLRTQVWDLPDAAVVVARFHVQHGRDEAARKLVAPIIDGSTGVLAPTSAVTAWLVESHVAERAGEPALAFAALNAAVDLAQPGGLVRTVLDAAPSVRRQLVRCRGRFGRLEPFVEQVLAVDAAPGGGHVSRTGGFALTARELAVLRELPSLLSLREIANANVVSVNTVKTQLRAIYRKLGVATRREAVDHARDLGML